MLVPIRLLNATTFRGGLPGSVTHSEIAALPEAGTQANLDRAAGTEMGSAERIPEVVRPSVARDVHRRNAQLEIDTPTSAEFLDQ